MKKLNLNIKFIKNEDLLFELEEFSKNQFISEKLHVLLYNLAKNISSRGNWAGYTWKEDMVSDAYLKCLHSLDKFDINKSRKPFSFFSIIIFRYYIDYIKRFKKHKIIIEKLEDEFKLKMNLEFGINMKKHEKTV